MNKKTLKAKEGLTNSLEKGKSYLLPPKKRDNRLKYKKKTFAYKNVKVTDILFFFNFY